MQYGGYENSWCWSLALRLMGGAGEMDKCIVDQRIGKFVMLVTGFVDDVRD